MRLREEQRRADKAEYSLIVQENEIMEWEADNERKRAAWEQKQAQRNALAIETARQQRDEDIAVAKAVAEKRVQRARDARKMDELKRSIRQNAAQLNQMLLRAQQGQVCTAGADRCGSTGGKAGGHDHSERTGREPADEAAGPDPSECGQREQPKRHDRRMEADRRGYPDPDAAGQPADDKGRKADQTARAAGRGRSFTGQRESMGTAGTAAQTHQGDGEPHLSAHDGGSDADAEGYYQLDAACDPQCKQDGESCKG